MNTAINNRIAWIDNARLFAILCVMFGHCCFCIDPNALNGYEVWGYQWQRDFIVSFNMPLFVFLSGFCAYKGINRVVSFKDLSDYWLKITKRIAVPMFCYNGILSIIDNIKQHDLLGLSNWVAAIVTLGVIHWASKNEKFSRFQWLFNILLYAVMLYELFHLGFWFLNMLLQIMVIISVMWYIKKLVGKEWVLIPLIVLAFALSLLIRSNSTKTEEFVMYFIAGMISYKYDIINNIKRPALWLLPLLIVGGFLLPVVSGQDFYSYSLFELQSKGMLYVFFLRQFCAFVWIAFFCLFFFVVSRQYLKISEWGGQTLPMYLIHATLLELYRSKIHFKMGSDFVLWGQLLLMFVILVLITCSFIWIFKKNEYTRVLLLGEK